MSTKPLSHVTVLDLSRVLGGPFCTQILADHGARVIKVEPPAGDETRGWGPPFELDAAGSAIGSAYYAGTNRGKYGIALDLERPRARDVVRVLLKSADVLVENFKIGTMERWGLGYERDLKPAFPHLIYARVSGFGADGPLGGLPGYDAVAQAMSGLISVNGSQESGPVRVGVPIVDMATGMNAALGILMALASREHTGHGEFVEATLYDTGLSLLHPHASNWLIGARPAKPSGNAHPNIVPYDLFETAKGSIFLGIGNDRQFAKALDILGRRELAADPRFKTNADRSRNRDALRRELELILMSHEAEVLADTLLKAGVPAGAAATVDEALAHPHTRHRHMVLESGSYRGVGSPITVGARAKEAVVPPPRFAQHTDEILAAAGYSRAEIADLIADGAVVREMRK